MDTETGLIHVLMLQRVSSMRQHATEVTRYPVRDRGYELGEGSVGFVVRLCHLGSLSGNRDLSQLPRSHQPYPSALLRNVVLSLIASTQRLHISGAFVVASGCVDLLFQKLLVYEISSFFPAGLVARVVSRNVGSELFSKQDLSGGRSIDPWGISELQ